MSPKARPPPTQWPPDRPKGFYGDWNTFCLECLTTILKNQEGTLAVALLAGGAVLGAGSITALIQANREFFDRKGQELGIPKLAQIAVGGAAMLGAAVGGLGGVLLNKSLSQHANRDQLATLQARLTTARREFELLRQDLRNGLLNDQHHLLAVERLFSEITQPV